MSGVTIAFASFVVITVLIYAGMHISTALFITSFGAIWLLRGDMTISATLLGLAATDAIADYEYGVIPLFVLMGFLVMVSGVGKDSYLVAHQTMRRVPGSLGHATVLGNAIFSAITGVSVAAVVLFTKLAVPEMLERGYDKTFAVGVVAGSAMLGMLIPPSVLMILYAILTDVSIGDLFLAGIIPGILMSVAFSAIIYWMAKRNPSKFGQNHSPSSLLTSMELLKKSLPILILVILVLGGMYIGFFTATEAGATGTTAAFLIAWYRKTLDRKTLWSLLVDTGHVTASLILIIIAANMFSRFLALSGLPDALEQWVTAGHYGLYTMLGIYLIVVLLLGTAMDSASTTLIAVPIFAVIFKALGADLIWIGIITMITVEIGLITPPLGIAPFVIKMTLDDKSITLNDIYMGAMPFALAAFVIVLLIIAFPWLATGLIH